MPTVTVDQAKLVLNAFAAIFQNNLVSSDVVTWKQYDTEMNDRNGLTVVEQVGPRYTITQTTNGVQDLSGGVQDTTFGSEQFKVNTVFGSSMGWGDFVKIRDIGDARESEAIKNAAINLAEAIDAYVLGFAAKVSNNWTGTVDNAIATFDDVANGYTRLKEEGVDDSDLRAVLTYGDKQALANYIVDNNSSMQDMTEGVYRSGFTGKVAGIPTLFTQQLPALTVGTRVATATSVTNYSSGTFIVDYADVAVSGAPGQYMTSTINFDGQTGSVTLKDGEVFTIAGVYAYDNRAKKQLGHLQQFRVIGDYTATAGAFSNVRIFPAPIASGPFQNIVNTNPGVDGLAITHIGAASATLHPRVILQKQAVVVNTADLIMPATGIGLRKQLSKVPVSVRMWKNSNFNTGEHDVRFDVAITANSRDRRRAVRINGA